MIEKEGIIVKKLLLFLRLLIYVYKGLKAFSSKCMK